jgi:GTP pyrophosphokinase
MRTLSDAPREKWARISHETLDIYAPIAHRLGLNTTYRELQELSFQHLYPWRYSVLNKALLKARGRRRDVIKRVQAEVESAFETESIPVQISGREKTLYSIYRKMDEKHLSFAQVTDIYGFRVIVDRLSACYTAMGVLHQHYKPLPGKFKDYIAIPKINGYQSLHTTLVGPFGTNIEFQMRTEAMHVVAESGVAAHWLYKAKDPNSDASQRLGSQWLQSLLDIQHETRDAAEFWDHVKIDLFPDAVYVFTPKSQIMAMPRGATIVDFAYAIHSDIGDRSVAAKVNGEQVPLRSELHNGDVIEIITSTVASPNPGWLSFVRTGKARSKIRHHLKTRALVESQDLGEKMLNQSLRAEGIEKLPEDSKVNRPLWEKILRFSGNRSRSDLLTDIGLGKRIASMVAKRIVVLLAEKGEKPDALLLSRERYTAHESVSQGSLVLDGSEGASVQFANCCKPIPGDGILGYLGRGEGLVVHTDDCAVAKRLQHRDSERFIAVDWSDEPTRLFETELLITVANGKGVLARVAAALATAEADITHVNMGQERAQDATELRFGIAVRDRVHLATVLRNVKRTSSVLRVQRAKPGG